MGNNLKEEIASLYGAGESSLDISNYFLTKHNRKISPRYIQRVVKEAGITRSLKDARKNRERDKGIQFNMADEKTWVVLSVEYFCELMKFKLKMGELTENECKSAIKKRNAQAQA